MGAYGANYGANYAAIALSVIAPDAPSTKTVVAILCVNESIKENLCVETEISSNLCVNESIKEDLCV